MPAHHPIHHAVAANNFLIPNQTFIVEVICFLIILYLLRRYAYPPINGAIEKRQQTIKRQFDEAEQALSNAKKAEEEYKEALAETRRETSRLREEAAADKAAIIAEARDEARRQAEEISEQNRQQIAAERQQAILALRAEIGELAVTLAERIVRESLQDDARQRRLVEGFIEGLGEGVEAATSGADR